MKLDAQRSRQYWRDLISNAVHLVDDASVLLKHGSAGRAHSLVILASEELARANAVYDSAQAVWATGLGNVDVPKNHLAVSKSHIDKIDGTESYGTRLEGFWGDYETRRAARDPKLLDRAKQDGFYVSQAPGKGGVFRSPLDFEIEPVAAELRRMAGVIEMALISDGTRMRDLAPERCDSTSELQQLLLPISHPELYADFIASVRDEEAGE